MKRINVLFVCLGNICRSPLAEAIFKQKLERKGLDKFVSADSCGTSNYHIGSAPDPRTIANAIQHGVEIDHCCRQLCAADFTSFDFILAMDKSNLQNILRHPDIQNHASKVKLMRDFDPYGKGSEVPDPYHGGEKGFQEVFDILDRSLDNFIGFLEEHLRQPEQNTKSL
jgi:protein-tyrosine phosphatase